MNVKLIRIELIRVILAGLTIPFFYGCAIRPLSENVIGPSYIPSNVYTNTAVLTKPIRRVAVLPVTMTQKSYDSEETIKMYQAILITELHKTKKYEVVVVEPQMLKQWTGKQSWVAEEPLPPDFFKKIKENTDSDAVLFSRVTVHRAYPPISSGWNMKLIECDSANILWSIDEVFDSGRPEVINGARRYYQNEATIDSPMADSHTIMRTPRLFCQYATYSALSTLPVFNKEIAKSLKNFKNLPNNKVDPVEKCLPSLEK